MKRIIVIGCPGSGKSTFSRALRDKTKIKLYYLDMIWHKADKTNISREDFDETLREILKEDSYIIDGNYIRTLEMRVKECDTIFYFDLPVELCLEGARSRIGKKREDLPFIEEEFDEEFKEWIKDFSRDQKKIIEEILKRYKNEKKIIVFKSHYESEEYLRKI